MPLPPALIGGGDGRMLLCSCSKYGWTPKKYERPRPIEMKIRTPSGESQGKDLKGHSNAWRLHKSSTVGKTRMVVEIVSAQVLT